MSETRCEEQPPSEAADDELISPSVALANQNEEDDTLATSAGENEVGKLLRSTVEELESALQVHMSCKYALGYM